MLRFVSDWAEQDQKWQDLAVPFLTKVRPKQRTVKTPPMSSALLSFASALPKQYATIMDIVAGRLVPMSRGNNMHLRSEVTDLDAAGIEALLTALQELLPEDRSEWPYEGKRIIDTMVAAGLGQGDRLDVLAKRVAERAF